MSTRYKALVFLALTFAFSWAVAISGWALELHESPLAVTVLMLMMAGPAVAALTCTFLFEPAGGRLKALGLLWTPNLWWLVAWAAILLLAILSIVFTVVLSDRELVSIGDAAREAALAQGQDLSNVPAWALSTPAIIAMAAVLGAAFNAVVITLTEELGWRGYLHHLWRPSGFWRASLATGFVWGLWRAPAILLYGLNYPANREIGIGIFVLFCMLLSPIMTFLRDRGRSVIAAGIAHGALNAMGGLTVGSLSDPSFPWMGIVGVGGFVALALMLGAVAWTRTALAPQAAGA